MGDARRRIDPQDRLRLVRLIDEEDYDSQLVADVLGVGHSVVQDWLVRYRRGGSHAITSGRFVGRPTSLADEQLRKLYRLIRDRDPDDFGFDAALWTRAVVRLLVHREFGLSLSPPTVSKVLGELGLHPARSSPPADVLGAMAVIRARSARAGAKLFFGKVYRVDREGYREEGWPDHVASVIDGRGQIMFHLFPERPDPGHLTDFARRVVGDLSKPAFVVVSGSPDCADSLRRIAGGSHGRLSIFLVPDSRGGGADFMQM